MKRCIKENELVLFYYQELKTKRLKFITLHLKECAFCSQRYKKIESFLASFQFPPLSLSEEDLKIMLENLKREKPSLIEKFKNRLKEIFHYFHLKLAYQPQIGIILTAFILILCILPFRERNFFYVDKNVEILQIEMELSSDEFINSIFELYEYNYNY